MAVPPSVPTLLGGLAGFTTCALLAVHAILVSELALRAPSPAYTAAIAAIALEGAALLVLSAHLASHVRRSRRSPPSEKPSLRQFFSRQGPWLLSGGLICTAAATVSVLALVRLAKAPAVPNAILGTNAVPFLCGASVTLGVCYIAQLLFLAALFAGGSGGSSGSSSSSNHPQPASLENGYGKTSRSVSDGSDGSNGSNGSSGSSKQSPSLSSRIKAVPYSKTRPEKTRPSREHGAAASKRTGLRDSLRLSLPHVVRPVTSKTRLLSPSHRSKSFLSSLGPALRGGAVPSLPPSTASAAAHELATRPSLEDFDSWDTSAVDPQSRRTVLASFGSASSSSSSLSSSTSSSASTRPTVVPTSRFLETIPASPSASPAASRSASPGTPLDLPHLQPQRHRRRRSDSPTASARAPPLHVTRTRAQSHSQPSQHAPPPIPFFPLPPPPSPSEAHIHPLFRSDSPNPAPSVSSAGTVVTAAPNGGQVLAAADASGLRTLNRMRSGSFPVVASPLSRQGSFEAWPLGPVAGGSRGGSRGGSSDGRSRAEEPDRAKTVGEGVDDEGGEDEDGDDEDDEDTRRRVRADSGAERKMTPPIPEWILSAGARRSLSGYQSRRVREAS